MKSLRNIVFGVLLGVAGCFAYYFYEGYEQGKKGLKRAWVPISAEKGDVGGKPAAATKGAPVAPKTVAPLAPKKNAVPAQPAAVAKTASPTATSPAATAEFRKRLAAEWWRWPETVTVRTEQKILFTPSSGGSIEFPIAAGATVRLHQMDSTGTLLFVYAKGSPFNFPIRLRFSDTDFLAKAKPEGTPRPVRVAAKPAATPKPNASRAKTAPPPTFKRSTSSASTPEEDEMVLPPPPQVSGPAPTLFGVPIQ